MAGLMNIYLVCFAAGFLLDKLRIFPFILGFIAGLVLKALIDNDTLFSSSELMEKINRLYAKLAPPQDLPSEVGAYSTTHTK
jgi:nucleoside recognition membrane protein YjiH